jgi:hypothetical protein
METLVRLYNLWVPWGPCGMLAFVSTEGRILAKMCNPQHNKKNDNRIQGRRHDTQPKVMNHLKDYPYY